MPVEGPSTMIRGSFSPTGITVSNRAFYERRARSAGWGWDRDWARLDLSEILGTGPRLGRAALSRALSMITSTATADQGDDRRATRTRGVTNLRLEGDVTSPRRGRQQIVLWLQTEERRPIRGRIGADEASHALNGSETDRRGDERRQKIGERWSTACAGMTIQCRSSPTKKPTWRAAASLDHGRQVAENDADLKDVVDSSRVYRPSPNKERSYQAFWFWLVLVAGMGLLLDVAIRRVAVEPSEMMATTSAWWDRLRGRRATPAEATGLDRLRARKAETVEQARATRRFEGEAPISARPAGSDASDAPRRRAADARGRTDRRRLRRPPHAGSARRWKNATRKMIKTSKEEGRRNAGRRPILIVFSWLPNLAF